MPHKFAQRYCADAQAVAAMRHDGTGWDHDLECGCFRGRASPRKPHKFLRFMSVLRGSI